MLILTLYKLLNRTVNKNRFNLLFTWINLFSCIFPASVNKKLTLLFLHLCRSPTYTMNVWQIHRFVALNSVMEMVMLLQWQVMIWVKSYGLYSRSSLSCVMLRAWMWIWYLVLLYEVYIKHRLSKREHFVIFFSVFAFINS